MANRPMYAFASQRPVPPLLAIYSNKRLRTGAFTREQVKDVIRAFGPEQVLFARFDWPGVSASLGRDYRAFRFETGERLFIRSNLLEEPQVDPQAIRRGGR